MSATTRLIVPNEEKQNIPTDWQIVRLSDLCAQDRQIVEPNSATAIQLPYLGLEHIESNTGRILKPVSDVDNCEGKSTTFAFDERHVLYGKLRPYLNKVALPDGKGRCTTELIPLLPHAGVSRRYLAWLLRRPTSVAAAMKEKTGSRMPRASMTHVLALRVAIPKKIAPQERLADLLDIRMHAIEKAKKNLLDQLELVDTLFMLVLEHFPDSVTKSKLD